jgi:predicted nucleic acid-binding protein
VLFVDSNVPMYLIGTAHPNRDALADYLRAHPGEDFVTSAEVYQEIVHRYVAADRREAIADAFTLLDGLVVGVFDIVRADVDAAHRIALDQRQLSGRDCLHLAVMRRRGVHRILTMDRGFDLWPGIERLPEP